MFTLTTHQASTWGYSIIQHPTLPNVTTPASISNLGCFTKPILAPNGNMYAISIQDTTTINGTAYNGVFLKIIPGLTNTGTTNWSAATFSYVFADGTPNDTNGFGKQLLPVVNNSNVNFNTGVLASNGLIYFPPNTGVNWVVFNPATETWKVTGFYKPTTTTNLTALSINCAVLGTDNKIYVLGGRSAGQTGFRITTSPLATNDTIENSYYDTYSTGSPLGSTGMSWKDSNNITYNTDTAVGGLSKAYDPVGGGTRFYIQTLNVGHDALVHPSGKIFINPAKGRGRIFYIDIAQYGTAREIVSEPAYFVNNYSLGNPFEGSYLILEKPRNADHNVNTLKIYVIPACTPSSPGTAGAVGNSLASTKLYVIDPVNKTMTEVNMNYSKNVGNANSMRGVGPKINLPNGHSVVYNAAGGAFAVQSQGGVIITGKDVPSTVTTGGNFIKITDKSIFQEDTQTVLTSKTGNIASIAPGFTGINGSCTPSWPHNGKTIVTGVALQYTEIVSVKGYGPDITNFNFSERDKLNYTLTANNLSSLGSTIYNSQFNTPK